MKKLYLLILLNTVLQYAAAQPKVYTTPQIGNIITTEYANTPGILPGAMGANKSWDYSNLKDSTFSSTVNIVDAAGTPYVANFPGAKYAASIGDTLFTYYNLESGNTATFGVESSLIEFKYSHPLVSLQYPFTYSDVFETKDTINALIPFTATTKLLDTILISGYGTLKMPEVTYNNVLQARHINASSGSITLPGGTVFPLPPTTDTTFNYYVNGQPFPILTYTLLKGKIDIIIYLKSSSLPLNFISFTAEPGNEAVKLNWQTGNESNTDYFFIQKSTDGTHFNVIGKVGAVGSGGNNYDYTDDINQTDAQEFYYRLQETDKDGKSIYSDVVTCKLSGLPGVTLYPNPANSNMTLSGVENYSSLKIYNIAGQYLKSYNINAESITVPLTDFLPGIYIAELSNGSITKNIQFQIK